MSDDFKLDLPEFTLLKKINDSKESHVNPPPPPAEQVQVFGDGETRSAKTIIGKRLDIRPPKHHSFDEDDENIGTLKKTLINEFRSYSALGILVLPIEETAKPLEVHLLDPEHSNKFLIQAIKGFEVPQRKVADFWKAAIKDGFFKLTDPRAPLRRSLLVEDNQHLAFFRVGNQLAPKKMLLVISNKDIPDDFIKIRLRPLLAA